MDHSYNKLNHSYTNLNHQTCACLAKTDQPTAGPTAQEGAQADFHNIQGAPPSSPLHTFAPAAIQRDKTDYMQTKMNRPCSCGSGPDRLFLNRHQAASASPSYPALDVVVDTQTPSASDNIGTRGKADRTKSCFGCTQVVCTEVRQGVASEV